MKTQTELKVLAAELAKFEASECSCKMCRGLCEMVPCMATPQEIKALIDAGHIDDLAPAVHWASVKFGFPPLECVMIKARDEGGCSLLKAGKCTIHAKGLKPSEGKFATCKESGASFPHIASTWLLEENAELVTWIMAQFPPLTPMDDEDKSFMGALSEKVSALFDQGADPNALNEAIANVVNDYAANKALRKMMVEVCRELRGEPLEAEEKICETRQ